MEVAQTSSTETQTPSVTADVTNTETSAPTEGAIQGGATPAPAEQPPAWTPDFKFKAAGAEHEIPEMYRGLVKDQKTLEEVKRLHEKAYGLDSLAQNRDTLKRQLIELQPRLQEYETVSQNIKKLSHFVENKDFDSFFQGIGVSDRDILKWVEQKIQLHEAAPEVRAKYEENRRLLQQQYDAETELERYRQQEAHYAEEHAFAQVFNAVEGSAKDFADYYDNKMGEQGAFLNLVIDKGIRITETLGREPDLGAVIELVKDELTKLGVVPQASAAPITAATTAAAQVKQKPTLPVVPAGGHSPVATPVKSMDDLKKRIAALG